MKKLITTFALFAILAAAVTTSALAQSQLPKIEIITPTNGQTIYGNKVPILFSIDAFTLIDDPKAKAQEGKGHILLWLDEENPTVENAIKVTSDAYTISDVNYGDHTLKAELVSSDNKSLNPTPSQTVNFKSAELPSSANAATTSFDKKTTLVILLIVALVIVAAWWYTKDEDLEKELEEAGNPKKPTRNRKTARKKSKKK